MHPGSRPTVLGCTLGVEVVESLSNEMHSRPPLFFFFFARHCPVAFLFFKKYFNKAFYFRLCWVFLAVPRRSLDGVCGLLIAVVSLAAKRRLSGCGLQNLWA